jgi:hypothetical protein
MINLDYNKDYYILVDQQGADFGGGRILEGKSEVVEQFQSWADSDERKISNYTFADLIDVWGIDILKYDGQTFRQLIESELKEKIY